ncbi:AAA family ATPase [Clostridium perfringens]|uniref:AAA family ATPase n=1 Tax=Clostridium perfringens TaxID=1502 RepID=UPI0018E4716F|nr:AAA family ATPase [Clostridium perfringens]MBI5987861.1 AAA family ATPase [Clostridium perfringens]
MEFTKTLEKKSGSEYCSETKYYIDEKGNIKNGGGAQSSYNLPKDFFDVAKEKGVIVQDKDMRYKRKEDDGAPYVLAKSYKFKLGNGVLWLIGDEFAKRNNKFIASLPSNNKFQLYRSVYNSMHNYNANKEEYEWFVKLYDKNLCGSELVLDIDEENKILTIDVRFNSIANGLNRNIYLSESNSKVSEDFINEYNCNMESSSTIDKPYNRIIFGAPGTGKSNKLENEKGVFGNNFERVTFHPNYSYSQFVGTYKPVPKKVIAKNGIETETITYEYVPGPFMRSLVKAIRSIKSENPTPYLLLIEEINRANVAAVFGDVFQLLDRKNGISEYAIETSEDMRSYLVKELGGDLKDYEKIRIPENLYIWATMNSADQGVFPMDTAFKRRWEFEYIGINENSSSMENVMVKLGDDNHDVNWNNLRKAINNKLSIDCKVNEDKLIGPYFLSNDIIKVSEGSNFVEDNDKFKKAFKSKVIMYLFEDAVKQRKQDLFVGCDCSRYSLICEAFDAIGEGIFGSDIISTELEEK